MKYVEFLGRVLFALIFVLASTGHFEQKTIAYGAQYGVPLASVAVPLAGIIAIVGGSSIALGFKTKWGAWLIVLFLVPVTAIVHSYWATKDPMQIMTNILLEKNLTLLGGALVIAYFGAGPLSLDAWLGARRASKKIPS